MTTVRVSRKTARILRVLWSAYRFQRINPEATVSSASVMRVARVGSGSYYPIMARLENSGWVVARKEDVPKDANRPPRTFYCLTDKGADLAREAIAEDDQRFLTRLRCWFFNKEV